MPRNSSEAVCTILRPQYKSSSTVSCLQKIRIFLGAAAAANSDSRDCFIRKAVFEPLVLNITTFLSIIDKFYIRMKDVLALQRFEKA